MEYVQYRRVIEAQKLLKDTDNDIISVYYECGFNNVQHFYLVFKKYRKLLLFNTENCTGKVNYSIR